MAKASTLTSCVSDARVTNALFFAIGLTCLQHYPPAITSALVLIVLLFALGDQLTAFFLGWFGAITAGAISALSNPNFAMDDVSIGGMIALAAGVGLMHTLIFATIGRFERKHLATVNFLLCTALVLPWVPHTSAYFPFSPLIPAVAAFPFSPPVAIPLMTVSILVVRFRNVHSHTESLLEKPWWVFVVCVAIVCSAIFNHASPGSTGPWNGVASPVDQDVRARSSVRGQSQLLAEIEDSMRRHQLTVTPEGALGLLGPYAFLKLEKLNEMAYAAGSQVIVGAYVASGMDSALSGAVLLGQNPSVPLFEPAQFVLPILRRDKVGLAIRGNPNAVASPTAPVVFICYEELLASSILRLRPDRPVVVLANHWWDNVGHITALQRNYGKAWDAISGRSVVRFDQTALHTSP